MMADTNLIKLAEKLDLQDMAGFTRKFVSDFSAAVESEIDLPLDSDWSGVICLGMGGSGAGGMYLKSLSDDHGGLPFIIWKDYNLPSWWGPEWLVLATSYSGNTEETLAGVRDTISAGGTVIGISSGGELSEILESHNDSVCIKIPSGQMPRSAFGHIFGTQLAICWQLGLLPRPDDKDLSEITNRLQIVSLENDISNETSPAASLAKSLVDKDIGIISPNLLSPAAYRFACQLNENSGRFARQTEIPEMNHNEIVAWSLESTEKHALLILTSQFSHSSINSRITWLSKELDNSVKWIIECEGNSLLEQLLYASILTDWISIALALLMNKNPSEMNSIVNLKEFLSSLQ